MLGMRGFIGIGVYKKGYLVKKMGYIVKIGVIFIRNMYWEGG